MKLCYVPTSSPGPSIAASARRHHPIPNPVNRLNRHALRPQMPHVDIHNPRVAVVFRFPNLTQDFFPRSDCSLALGEDEQDVIFPVGEGQFLPGEMDLVLLSIDRQRAEPYDTGLLHRRP